MKLSKIKPNKANPRIIRDHKFKKLKKSIEEFPAMMELRPIVVDRDGTILGGNMRYKAISDLGYKDIPDTWVKVADTLTDEEKQRFIIEDNVGFGEWDFDSLANEWDFSDLDNWGVDLPDIIPSDTANDDTEVVDDYAMDAQEEKQQQIKNSELDDFGDGLIVMKLKLSIEEHSFVRQELAKIDASVEIALLKLLGYE